MIQGAAARDVVTSFGPGVCVSSSAGQQPVSNATQVGLSYIGSFFFKPWEMCWIGFAVTFFFFFFLFKDGDVHTRAG